MDSSLLDHMHRCSFGRETVTKQGLSRSLPGLVPVEATGTTARVPHSGHPPRGLHGRRLWGGGRGLVIGREGQEQSGQRNGRHITEAQSRDQAPGRGSRCAVRQGAEPAELGCQGRQTSHTTVRERSLLSGAVLWL